MNAIHGYIILSAILQKHVFGHNIWTKGMYNEDFDA